MRAGRGQGVPHWPEWCYIPIAGTYAAVAEDAGVPDTQLGQLYPERVPDAARLAALAAWRMTQGIYRFDPAVYDAVHDTPISGDIPHEVLYRLPEWCVYIETPGLSAGDAPLAGVFVHLEHDYQRNAPELRLVLDVDSDQGPALVPVPLHLGSWSLAESIERVQDQALRRASEHGFTTDDVKHLQRPHLLHDTIGPLLNLTLYLCSQAGEIGDNRRRPANPQPVHTRRHGLRLFPANGPTTWDVGVRLGAALRRAYAAEQTGQGSPHAGPKGHVRRAHWHTILSGPRLRDDGSAVPPDLRHAKLLWMPPIPVKLGSVDELPAVIRRVGP